MNWFTELFTQSSVAQTILLMTIIAIAGLAIGRIKIGSFSLGSSCVFFVAIAAGHFADKLGIVTNPAVMDFVKSFGLVVFVYTLGLQVGPGFFSSLRKGGLKLNVMAIFMALLGSVTAIIACQWLGLGPAEAVGLLAGAVTNTPAMVAAQQTVLDVEALAVEQSHAVAAAYAVAYPFSVLTLIFCVAAMKALFPKSAEKSSGRSNDKFTGICEVSVLKPELFGKSIKDIVSESGFHFVISRLWRDGQVQIPLWDTVVQQNDHLLIICKKDDEHKFGAMFGHEEATDWNRPDIDWNIIDKNLVSRHVRVTRKEVVGVKLSKLKLRNKFGVNITRINRAGIYLVPDADTRLQFGDRLTVVGDEEKIKALGKAVGNEEQRLNDPRLIPILAGIFLGVLLGSVPIVVPGISTPLKLGIAGGPIIMGILMGAFGPKLHITTYTTRAANLMLRQMGITFFFASLGFGVGRGFVETVFCMQGLKWAGIAVMMAAIPFFITGIFNEKVLKMDFARNMGLLCGTCTNPNALAYTNSILDNDNAAEAYATVYPLVTFFRVFASQILIVLLWA